MPTIRITERIVKDVEITDAELVEYRRLAKRYDEKGGIIEMDAQEQYVQAITEGRGFVTYDSEIEDFSIIERELK